jgi:putative two-component system response regulator
LEARIVAVADVFDALTSARPYKPAWSNDKAINTLNELAGE